MGFCEPRCGSGSRYAAGLSRSPTFLADSTPTGMIMRERMEAWGFAGHAAGRGRVMLQA